MTTNPRITLFAGLAALVVVVAVLVVLAARPAQAQTTTTIDTIPTVSNEVVRMLITVGESGKWYSRFGSEVVGSISDDSDVLIKPDPTPSETDNTVALDVGRVWWLADANYRFRINRSDPTPPLGLSFAAWLDPTANDGSVLGPGDTFPDGSPGATMSVYVAIDGVVYETTISGHIFNAGHQYWHIVVDDSDERAVLDSVAPGDLVGLVIGDSGGAPAPTFTPALSGSVGDTQELTIASVAGIENVTITETQGTGDLTLRTSESGLDCDTQTNELNVAATGTFWVKYCDAGTTTLRIADAADDTSYTDYSVTIAASASAPAQPAAPTVTALSRTSIRATWEAPDGGGSAITHYVTRYRATSAGAWQDEVLHSATVLSRDITGLEPNTEYEVQVKARNAVGDSTWSSSGTTTTTANSPPVFSEGARAGRNIAENSLAGSHVGGVVLATDAEDDTIAYSISGTDARFFTLNRSTGQIGVASSTVLDYESRTTYVVTITAVDAYGSDSIVITITVDDVDERPTLSPDPSTITARVGNNQAFSIGVVNGSSIQNVLITETRDTGDLTLRTQESGLDCDTQVNELDVPATGSIWALFCYVGEVTLRIADSDDSGVYRDYVIDIQVSADATAPGQVTGLTATPGAAQVVLSWTAPDSGGSPILRYEYSSDNGTRWRTTGGTTTSYTATLTSYSALLVIGNTYFWRVRAVNAVGNGTASDYELAAASAEPTAPGAVQNFDATASTTVAGQVALDWDAPASTGGSPIIRYEYRYHDGDTAQPGWTDNGVSTTDVTLTGLTNYGESHTFWVRAVNSVGFGPFRTANATPGSVPDAPTGLSTSPGDTQVTLSWTAPDGNGGAIFRYDYSSDDGSSWTSTGSTSTSRTVTGLTNGTEYTFRVRAVNSYGLSAASASAAATPTVTLLVPGQVTGLSATPGDAEFTLSWSAPSSDGGSPITDYDYTTDGGTTWRATGSTGTSYVVTQLSFPGIHAVVNGQNYVVRVRAVNAIGNGPRSTLVTVEPNPPASITGVAVSAITASSARATVSLSNPGSLSTAVYGRYRPTLGGSWVNLASQTTSGTSVLFIMSGLTAGTDYRVEVSISSAYATEASALFTTTTTVAISPDPSALAIRRLQNYEFSAVVSAGVDSYTISETPDTGDITLRTTEAGLNCGNQTNEVSIPAGDGFWLRACSAGDLTLTITDDDDSTVSVTYDVTVLPVLASVTGVSVASITSTAASITAGVNNPDSQAGTVHIRYRTPPDSGSWTDQSVSVSGSNTAVTYDATGLSPNREYEVRASISSSFPDDSTHSTTFTTLPTPASVTGLSIGSVTSSGATATVALTNPHSQAETVYFRWRTPQNTGTWSATASVSTSGTEAEYVITGLDSGASYQARASLHSDFPAGETESATFTTLRPYVDSVSAVATSRTTATATLNIVRPNGRVTDYYLRWRTPPGSGAYGSTVTVSFSGASGSYDITGLTEGTQYRVEADENNAFATPRTADFTTLANRAPAFGASAVTLSILTGHGEGTQVATPVQATDPDGDVITYSLGGTDGGDFEVEDDGQLIVGAGVYLDESVKDSYSLTLTATDPSGGSDSVAVTIRVEQRQAGGGGNTPPQFTDWRDFLCLGGFPGCPDTYVFLLPTLLAAAMVFKGSQWSKELKRVEVVGGAWLVAFVAMGLVMHMEPVRLIGFIVVSLAAGMVFLAVRR